MVDISQTTERKNNYLTVTKVKKKVQKYLHSKYI